MNEENKNTTFQVNDRVTHRFPLSRSETNDFTFVTEVNESQLVNQGQMIKLNGMNGWHSSNLFKFY
jgi:hypothetical protein